VSDFDQGGGSGMDEPANVEPIRVAVFLPRAESAEIAPFYLRRKCRNRAFFTCAESAVFGRFS